MDPRPFPMTSGRARSVINPVRQPNVRIDLYSKTLLWSKNRTGLGENEMITSCDLRSSRNLYKQDLSDRRNNFDVIRTRQQIV